VHVRVHRVAGERVAHRVGERAIPVIGHFRTDRAVRPQEPDRDRLHERARSDRGLQQRGVKREHPGAVGGRALGKDRDDIAGAQRIRHLVADAVGVAAAVALQEEGPRPRGEVAHHRPRADLRFRDEAHGVYRQHGEDVEPRNVIGHDEHRHPAARQGPVHVQPHADELDQGARPATNLGSPARRGAERKDEKGRGKTPREVPAKPHDARRARGESCSWGRARQGSLGLGEGGRDGRRVTRARRRRRP